MKKTLILILSALLLIAMVACENEATTEESGFTAYADFERIENAADLKKFLTSKKKESGILVDDITIKNTQLEVVGEKLLEFNGKTVTFTADDGAEGTPTYTAGTTFFSFITIAEKAKLTLQHGFIKAELEGNAPDGFFTSAPIANKGSLVIDYMTISTTNKIKPNDQGMTISYGILNSCDTPKNPKEFEEIKCTIANSVINLQDKNSTYTECIFGGKNSYTRIKNSTINATGDKVYGLYLSTSFEENEEQYPGVIRVDNSIVSVKTEAEKDLGSAYAFHLYTSKDSEEFSYIIVNNSAISVAAKNAPCELYVYSIDGSSENAMIVAQGVTNTLSPDKGTNVKLYKLNNAADSTLIINRKEYKDTSH